MNTASRVSDRQTKGSAGICRRRLSLGCRRLDFGLKIAGSVVAQLLRAGPVHRTL